MIGIWVLEDGGGSGVVEGSLAGVVGADGDEVGGVGGRWFGAEDEVGGLAGADDSDISVEGFDVGGVGFDDGEGVVGDAEEEFVVEGGVDEAEEVCLPRLDL